MKVKVKIDEKKYQLIKQQLNIDLKIGIPAMVKRLEDSLYQIAMMKKSGVNIDLEKIAKEGLKMGEEVTREARGEKKDESAKD